MNFWNRHVELDYSQQTYWTQAVHNAYAFIFCMGVFLSFHFIHLTEEKND